MSENATAMVRAGINAYKGGNKDEARTLLLRAVEVDPYNEEGWLWLSGLLESLEEQRTCLENVLAINPANERARKGLDFLLSKGSSAPEPPRASATATSVEWAAPNEEAPRASRAFTTQPDTNDADYDKWVTDLNLPAQNKGDAAFSSDVTFDDTTFTQGPFSAAIFDDSGDESSPAVNVPPQRQASAAAFTDDDDEPLPSEANAAIAAAAAALSAPVPTTTAQPAAGAAASASPFAGVDLDATDDFGAEPAAKPAAKPRRDRAANKAAKVKAEPEVKIDAETRAILDTLAVIPREIRPTRLPGVRERQPILLVLAFVGLLLLNIGAAVLLVNRILVPL
jgi:hypothetical protein